MQHLSVVQHADGMATVRSSTYPSAWCETLATALIMLWCATCLSCRLILFLQQSSVEWASSLWMHVVQELDPQYQRTVRHLLTIRIITAPGLPLCTLRPEHGA
jgi:hypothetical protein